jgi:7-cyano-7-deazaguanine synthase
MVALTTAVLLSAGLDSAVLAASEARRAHVQPIYVSTGLAWEVQELEALHRLLATPPFASLASLAHLTFTVRDLYPPTHWALRGEPPAFDTPDEDVYLTGRNVILLSKASLYCAQHGHRAKLRLDLSPAIRFPTQLRSSSTRWRARCRSGSLTKSGSMRRLRQSTNPTYRDWRRTRRPLELTLSCMNPREGLHCGDVQQMPGTA